MLLLEAAGFLADPSNLLHAVEADDGVHDPRARPEVSQTFDVALVGRTGDIEQSSPKPRRAGIRSLTGVVPVQSTASPDQLRRAPIHHIVLVPGQNSRVAFSVL